MNTPIFKKLIAVAGVLISGSIAMAQAPDISYTTPPVYTVNTAITALKPSNTGGVVKAGDIGQVGTFAGANPNRIGANAAGLELPYVTGITTDAAGNVFVSSSNIYKITPDQKGSIYINQLGPPFQRNTGAIADGFFTNSPTGICMDASNSLYAAEVHYNGDYEIKKFTATGKTSIFYNGHIDVNNVYSARFCYLAVDAAGNLYITISDDNRIQKISPAGTANIFAGDAAAGTADGTGTDARFSAPGAITLDKAGNLYVCDNDNGLIRKITPGGVVNTLLLKDENGPVNKIQLSGGIALGPDGNIYFVRGSYPKIMRLAADGMIAEVAGEGTVGYANGSGLTALFNSPLYMTFDVSGSLLICDAVNSAVRKVNIAGYYINKVLPAGLTFDSATGSISGTPTAVSPATEYTITAYNIDGSSSAKISIEVKGLSTPLPPANEPPKINYQTPQVYTVNQPVASLQPVNTGGAVTGGNTAVTLVSDLNPNTHVFTVDGAGNLYVAHPFENTFTIIKTDGTRSTVTVGLLHPFNIAVDRNGKYMYSIDYFDLSTWKTDLITGKAVKLWDEKSPDVALDGSGNVYELQADGIVKYSPDGLSKTVLYSNVQANASGNIAVNTAGTLIYWQTGASDNLYVLNTQTGNVSTLLKGSQRVNAYMNIFTDNAGNLYGASYSSAVDKFDAVTGAMTNVVPFRYSNTKTGTGPFSGSPTLTNFDIALDNEGAIYLLNSDVNNRQVQKLSTQYYTIDKPLPAGLIFDTKTGNITGTPTANSPATDYTITAYNSFGSGSTVLNIAVKGLALKDIKLPQITYTTPNIYKVSKPITPLAPKNTGGEVPATVYGQVSTAVQSGNGVYFSVVTGVTTDAGGNIYIADYGSHIIYKQDAVSGKTSVFAGSGASDGKDGQGRAASFNLPDALITDAAGNIYVSDLNIPKIRKITPGGLVTTLAGSGDPGSADGQGRDASFYSPRGLTIDAAGNIYVADQGNNLIRKITPAGLVSTVAGNTNAGFANGTGTAATFNTPTAVAADAAGNLYVSDAGNGAIRKITPAGVVTTFAAGFNRPRELRVDGSGNIYVGEQNGQVIKRISPAGEVAVVAGTGATGSNNGPGNIATFNSPLGMAMDGQGNLFIGETDGNLVRKVIISGYTIDKPLPAGLTFDPTTGIITGTPTVEWPLTTYKVTAYNGAGSYTTSLDIEVKPLLLPSIITFPPPVTATMDVNGILQTGVTSTNNETPVTYTSSNPDVAYVGNDGQIYVIKEGYTTITANQKGNDNYSPASPVTQFYTFRLYQIIDFPVIAAKSTCDISFSANALSNSDVIPLTYTSSNPAVATVAADGKITIVGSGTTTITVEQAEGTLYIKAKPVSRTLTVVALVTPSININPVSYDKCAGETLTFTATAANAGTKPTYQWKLNGNNTGSNQATYSSSTLKTGDVVTCVVTNNDGCQPVASAISNTAAVTVNPNLTFTASITSSATGTVLAGVPVTFTATVKPVTADVQFNYDWQVNGLSTGSNGATFTSSKLMDKDVISCIISVVGKCVITPQVTTNQLITSINTQRVAEIIVPNTFTPNGDGINDVWNIPGLLAYPDCTINIYNRYGDTIYQSFGYKEPWDGNRNGTQLPAGVYYYIINFKSSANRLAGSITIIR